MKPNYVAKKSVWPAFKLRRLLFLAVVIACFFFVEPLQNLLKDKASVELDSLLIMIALGVLAAIPVLTIIIHVIILAHIRIEFYDTSIVVKRGVFNKTEKSAVFMGVLEVSLKRSFFGNIFNHGDVIIKNLGKLNVDTTKISKPAKLQEYLKTRFVSNTSVNVVLPMR